MLKNASDAVLIDKGLAGYAYSLEKNPAFASEWRFQWFQNSLILEEMFRLGRLLAEQQREVVVLKGAAWLDEIYEDRGIRSMADLDLFVPAREESEIRAFLLAQGYEEFRGNHFEAAEFSSVFRRKVGETPVYVDLHYGKIFTDEEGLVGWETESFAPGLRRLKKEEALLHFAGHIAFQNAFHRVDLVLDIDYFLRRFGRELNWARLWSLSRRWKKNHALQSVLWCAQKNFGTLIPQGAVGLRGRILFPWLLSEQYLLHTKNHRLRYLFLKHFLKDSVLEAWKTDWKWIRHMLKFR